MLLAFFRLGFLGLNRQKIINFFAYTLCALFILAGSLISIHRYWQYEIWYYDFGIFDTAIREVAKFQTPIIDHFVVEDKPIWADHFHPGIFLLSPIYWFTDRSEALLIAQAVIVGLSGLVLYKTGVTFLKSHFLSLAVLFSYLFFAGIQNAVLTEFHELAIMTLPLMLTYWAILTNRKKWFVVFLILTLSFKESLFALGIGLSFFVFIFRPAWRKLAIITAGLSLAWGWLSIKIILPYFSGHEYPYAPKYEGLAATFKGLTTPVIKVKTTLNLFWSFLFLPLLYLPTLPIIALNLTSRYLSLASTRWELGMHYNAEIAPTLAISCFLAFAILLKKLKRLFVYAIAIVMIVNSVLLYHVAFKRPFALAYNRAFYAHTQNFTFLNDLIARVPKDGLLMTQNNLAARFTHRGVKLLRDDYKKYKAMWIVLDVREGQNVNNFYGIGGAQDFFNKLFIDPAYYVYYKNNDQYIFKLRVEEFFIGSFPLQSHLV